MKHKIERKKEGFEPIKVEITIQSEAELKYFVGLLSNDSCELHNDFVDTYKRTFILEVGEYDSIKNYALFDELHKHIQDED